MMRTNRILTTLRKIFLISVIATVCVGAGHAQAWDGTTPATLADAGISGTGQAESPYIINSAKAFAYFGSVMEGNTNYWEIPEGVVIDLGGNKWEYGLKQGYDTSKAFKGSFNGNGSEVKNFTLDANDFTCGGLFYIISGTVERLKVSGVTFTDGNKWQNCYYGIFAGGLDGGTISKCQVLSSSMSFTQTMSLYGCTIGIGGMVGAVNSSGAVITDSKVSGVSITTAALTVQATKIFMGGVAGTVAAVSNLNRCGASNVTINAPLNKSNSAYGTGHISAGGVIGNITQPCTAMPEDLCALKCKIYCPRGSVGPVCGMFLKSSGSSGSTVSDDYSAENGEVSEENRSKTSTWMYNGYQLGLNDGTATTSVQLQTRYQRNYTDANANGSSVYYLDLDDATVSLPKANSVSGSARTSHTVLWYTQNNGANASSATTQAIMPNYGSLWGQNFPQYYCYFMQGYNVGSYVSEDLASSFIESLAKVTKRAKLTLVDEDFGQRGTSTHTINLTVVAGDDANVTWDWYINGEKQNGGSLATLEVAPKYSAAVTVMVQTSDGASATLTLPKAYLSTLNSPHTPAITYSGQDYSSQIGTIAADNATRGTKNNPYVISTEEELRLWSDLSRMTGTIDNGPIINTSSGTEVGSYEDGANHFNTAYFVLGDNIEMDVEAAENLTGLTETVTYTYRNGNYLYEADKTYDNSQYRMRHKFNPAYHFEPICGFTSEDIYDAEHTFRGNFDGDGKYISGIRQVWRGGALNMSYAERATQNWGLFGCVGGDASHPAVIKNLIIKDAKFEHDVYNGTFQYEHHRLSKYRSTDTRGTSCAVGVLAGMVTNNSEIKNIDVKGCAIYASCVDNATSTRENNTYDLIDICEGSAVFHLWVGGIVGRVQQAFDNQRGDLAGSIKLHYLSADVDLDVFPIRVKGTNINTAWASPDNYTGRARRFVHNIGGIVGSMYSTASYSSIPWPEHSFFIGQMRGIDALSGPIFGFVNYGSMTENITTPQSAHEHWIGYPGIIKTGYYNNFYLRHVTNDENNDYNKSIDGKTVLRSHAASGMLWQSRSGGQTLNDNEYIAGGLTAANGQGDKLWYIGPITSTSPASPLFECQGNYEGARSILAHSETILETKDDISGYYQGVNQGIWKDWTVQTIQSDLVSEFDKNDEKKWSWDAQAGRPILTSVNAEHLEATLVSENDVPTKIVAELQGVTTGLNEYEYAWYDACHDNPVQPFKTESNGGREFSVTQQTYDQFYYAVAKKGTEGVEGYKYFKSALIRVPGTFDSSEIGAELNLVSTPIAASTLTHEQYLNVRLSQSEYYELPAADRLKKAAVYYPCKDVDDCLNKWLPDYEASLKRITLVITGEGENATQTYEESEDTWNTAYTDKPIYGTEALTTFTGKTTYIINWATIWGQYKAHFDNPESENATVKDDETSRKMLLQTGEIYYSYAEFLAMDVRTGEYDADATNYGYSYEFNDNPNDSRAGITYVNRNVTIADFNNLDDEEKKVPAQVENVLTVTLNPTESWLEEHGYTVEYQWYKLDGTIIEGATENSIVVTNASNSDRGSYLCNIKVLDNHGCNEFVLFDKSISKTWGKSYIYINPDGKTYAYTGTEGSGTTGVGKDTNDGKTPETPVKTWPVAYSLLKETGTWDENQIILIGTSSQDETIKGFGLGTQNFNGNNTTGAYDVWYQRGQTNFMTRNATITSKRQDGATFSGKLEMANSAGNGTQFALFGDTRLENLELSHCSPSGGYGIIMCQYHSLEMGEGIIMSNFPSASSASAEVGPLPGTKIADLQIFGGCCNDDRFLRMPGSVANYENEDYIPHPEGFTITVKSGFYSNICASGRQSVSNEQNGIAGTPNRPIKCKIVVDIDRTQNNAHNNYGNSTASYDVGAVMAGNHEGAQYGDVDIIIRSGIIGRVTSGSLGNKRLASNFGSGASGFKAYKSYYGTDADVYQPFDTYFGRCNILIDPESSEMNKAEDYNSRVVLCELYGGALGRHMGSYSSAGVCMSTFYGKTNITINGGTFDINSPEESTSWTGTAGTGSGKYGLAAYSNSKYTVGNKEYYRAQPGIYAAGAGGFNGIGSDELHTNDLRLPYWVAAKTKDYYNPTSMPGLVDPSRVVAYGPYDTYKTKTGTDKVYITCIDSIRYGRIIKTTQIDPAETSTTITINGGIFYPRELPQGAGIYGAGNGYVNNQLIGYPNQAPNPLGGSLLGKPGKTAVEMNINGGTFNCNIYGGGRGNDIYYNAGLHYHGNDGSSGGSNYAAGEYAVNQVAEGDDNYGNYDSFGTTLDNYSRNARIVGNVVMNINGGLFKQNIYGSGSGSTVAACAGMAEVLGSTTININSDISLVHVLGNVYGGGENARVRENAEVNVNKGIVYGSVYGGGNNATVGKIGEMTVYSPSDLYSLADNVYTGDGAISNEEAEEKGIIKDANGIEHNIGDPKDGATGTQVNAGLGHTTVYTKTESAYVYGNIYGGGNQAEVNGSTYVGMTAGHIGGAIFGGGNGVYVGDNNAGNKDASIHGSTEVFLNGYTVMWDKMFDVNAWNLLSYNAKADQNDIDAIESSYIKKWSTNKDRFINSSGDAPIWLDPFEGNNAHNVFGGGNTYCSVDSTTRVTVTRGMTPKDLLETNEWKNSFYDNDNPHFYIFGGGYGEHTSANNTYVNVGLEGVLTEDATTDEALAKPASIFIDEDGNEINAAGDNNTNIGIFSNAYGIAGYTVLGVLGGGMKGIVNKDTEVIIGGNTFIHRVYGGGYGKPDRVAYTEATDFGRVYGNTHVTANGGLVNGDIFGGGARGDVDKTTLVEVLRDCKVYGSVYGGGDVASVGNKTYTSASEHIVDTISTVVSGGGIIYRNVFAGGSKGPVYGSTLLNVVDSVMNGKPISPYIYGDVYGGGEKAFIVGNSNVLIEGGLLSGDIFGGGLGTHTDNGDADVVGADIQKNSNVTVNGGSMLWSQKCSDYEKGTVYYFDNTNSIPIANFKSGEITAEDLKGATGFYDFENKRFLDNHNVYGGGNINCTVSGNTNVTLNHGLITEGLQYYDASTITPFAVLWYNVIQNKSYPQFSVLGGGYGKNTTIVGNTNVAMNVANFIEPGDDATQTEKDAYNSYKSYKSFADDLGRLQLHEAEMLSHWQSLDENQKRLLYGGTNANVYRRYRASRYAWSGGVHGHVMANIYGGSWAGKVQGNSNVEMNGTSGCRNVFGGGVGMASENANTIKFGEVLGQTTVTVNGAIISGDVFGGGAGVESALDDSGTPTEDYENVARVVDKTFVSINGTVSTVGTMSNANSVDGETPTTSDDSDFPIDGTLIYGSVIGGGDVASVGAYQTGNNIQVPAENADPVTTVNVNGGLIFSPVYGGGSGRQNTSCVDYTKLGAVYGNTAVSVNTPAGDVNSPWLWHRTYGGGMNGTVYGHTTVNINGGNFGYGIYGGGYGQVDTTLVNNKQELVNTDAAVKGNTHVNINGGEWCISQTWVRQDEDGNDVRAWKPASQFGNATYSSQYDPENKRFLINHNIYGGGNICSTVGGSTYVNMTKGMLNSATPLGRDNAGENMFAEAEWKESYDKVGSAHFSVFGGGYGDQTLVNGDTHVDVSIKFDGDVEPSSAFENPASGDPVPYYQRFVSLQSLLDVIGGGYNGLVNGETYVHIGENTFMRRVFTGGYYAPVKETNLLITSGDIDEIFGGGLIGDVYENTNVQVGWRDAVEFDGKSYNSNDNNRLFVNKNVYGGNDVSGTIGYKDEQHEAGQGTYLKMYGGNLYGDVYGGGNGNYLYALGVNGETKVTPNEHYLKTDVFEGYDLVYTVPMRKSMMSASYASDPQKIVNINTFRPSTIESNIELYGHSGSDRLVIKGNVFGGGNSATVDGVIDDSGKNSAKVNFKIKDNIDVGGVFLGSDGDALFKDSKDNPFLSNFQTINNVNLEDTVMWTSDPANHGIKEKYLPVRIDQRPIVYPHLLDLYFQPVEMSIQPVVKWGTSESVDGNVNNAKIGIFCCGGNRGNMNVYPSTDNENKGNVVDIKFPVDLVITDHIIGGCNNANYEWHNTATGNVTKHTGGYLLGARKSENPMIKLLVRNKFEPYEKEVIVDGNSHMEYTGGNVYGGCYKSGTINGDVTVDLRSNMLKGLKTEYFENISDIGASACNVYGAGYGTNSYVYGDTKVIVGAETNCQTNDPKTVSGGSGAKGNSPLVANADSYTVYDDEGTSANYIFGGGLQGNVVGNATVRYLNGRTLHSVTGGSYAGYLWGSTQVLVGYPDYYTVKEGKQAVYAVKRKDKSQDNLNQTTMNMKGATEKAIKQEVKLMAGDIIAPTLYESIVDANSSYASAFEKSSTTPTMGWDNVDINIGEAIYGGGYSLASGSSVMANNTIVLKYDNQYNTDDATTTFTSVGYGGNTTMVVWDKITYNGNYVKSPSEDDNDHITISQQEMIPVDLPEGTDLFGYYYRDESKHYHYIYEENKYFQGLSYPKPPHFTGTFVSAYDFEAEGGMYGDGHLSFSEGFRTGEIKGYGFNGGRTIEGARLMNSFQRMDILRVEDCNVIMLGARDYATNVTNTTPYSMSRIGELQMVSHIDDSGDLQAVSNVTLDENTYTQGAKGARNFLGLSNNLLYVGCIYTNTSFANDTWHDYNQKIGDVSYEEKKLDYINKFYSTGSDKIDELEFQKRNDATAKNLLGVSSGYALKIQNVYSRNISTVEEGDVEKVTQVDSVFYGPIVGVAEINLMSSRLDEGGGYIYADNIHDHSGTAGDPDFLLTTGNFVFPHNDQGRYILDDCYVKTYDETLGKGDKAEPAHYWYIQGYNYFYNIHITGYTSDSRTEPLKFDSDNTDLLTIMKGAKKGQQVTLHSIRWRSEHEGTDTSDDKYDECDIDGNYKAAGLYPASMTEGAATYGSTTLDQRWNDTYYKLRLSAHDDTTLVYNDAAVMVDNVSKTPVHGDLQRATNMTTATLLNGELITDEPVIAMQLVDAVDNTTEAYYKRHLSKTCKATIVLTVPALKTDGTPDIGYTTIANVYTTADHVGLEDLVGKNYTFKMDSTYYYFNDNTHEYNQLDMSSLVVKTGTGNSESDYSKVIGIRTNEDGLFVITYDGGSVTQGNFFQKGTQNYTYTLYLTIDYVQGPEVRGHINIHNCALPGEMVRLTTEGVKVSGDDSMAPIGYYWRIGMREYDEESKRWVFADKTDWVPATSTEENAPEGYDSYRVNGDVHNGVFKGAIFDQTEQYLDIPVYYFMNGYGVQYGIEFNGLEGKIFPVSMAEGDTLLIHNYHRMATHSTNDKLHLHLSEAAARAKAYEDYVAYEKKKVTDEYASMTDEEKAAWDEANPAQVYVSPLNRPRVYLEDEEDLVAFYDFVDKVGRSDNGNYITQAQIGTKKYDVPTGGNYVKFFMQDNITISKQFYHAPTVDFEGYFDGRGHSVNLTDAAHATEANVPAFMRKVTGNVYNVGVIGRALATSLAADEKVHVHNSFVYGMNGNTPMTMVRNTPTADNEGLDNCYDLSVAEDADFKYGRIAYNLNKYYLAERYRRAKSLEANEDNIEDYFDSEDYQYAHRKDERTGKTTGVVYLRTGNDELPAYSSCDTRHDMTHAIDMARATITHYTQSEVDALNEKYAAEYAFEINAATTGSSVIMPATKYTTSDIKSVKYTPLFNQSEVSAEVGQTKTDSLRNDYILFGQNLTETPDELPKNIASTLVNDATNRVWRASGFYGSKKDEGFYYNAMTNMTTMVSDPRLTAVDLTCQRDGEITAERYQNDVANKLTSVSGAATAEQSVFFAPTKDTPADAAYWKFDIAEAQVDGTHVTQNLLVYTASETNAGTKVRNAIEYDAADYTEDIRGHRVVINGVNKSANLLHLVDKEDFNAPMSFIAENAWYDRDPSMETGYVDAAGQGWESVSLPFTVKQTSLSTPIERFYDYADQVENAEHVRNTKKEDQTNISFFYGEEDNVEDNPNIINHEYWLRALTNVDRPAAADSKLSGIFKRPVNSQENGGFAAYTPFIVSFPGEPFYEFDMTGRTMTFSNTNTPIAVTDDAVEETKVQKTNGTSVFTHYATFKNEEGNAASTYAIALKESASDDTNIGDKFTIGAQVYPFRAKIVRSASSGAKAASYADLQEDVPEFIYINALGISLEDKGIEEPETDEVIESDGLRIYPASGKRIVVESTYATTVNVYTSSGQLVRVLDVRPGTSIYSGFAGGVYVVEQKKLMLK